MGIVTIAFKLTVLLAVAKVLILSPNWRDFASLYLHDLSPRMSETLLHIYPDQLVENFLSYGRNLSLAVWSQPATMRVSQVLADAAGFLHDQSMSHTRDFLRQLLGVEVVMLTDEAPSKFLSALLFLLWLLFGLVAISKLSFRKCLVVMSAAFLLHAHFGSVWCLRFLAFVFGLILWMGAAASSRPVPTAITVLVMLVLIKLVARRQKGNDSRKKKDFQECNNNEDRIDKLDKKMDLLLSQMERIMTKLEVSE